MRTLAGLLDDAAVFPPGNAPLEQAVDAHVRHLRSVHAGLVGPLVLAAKDLGALEVVLGDRPGHSVDLTLTVPLPGLVAAVATARAVRSVRLFGLEVALPDGVTAAEALAALDAADLDADLTTYVEVPRDGRRADLLASLARTSYRAKLRTGGVRADLYPDETELAAAVRSAVSLGVPFKATAGLHHAVRNTDPATGFEQHGFLNVLVATGCAQDGGDDTEVAKLLAERDGGRLAEQVRALEPSVRDAFCSFGTCSIDEPVTELVDLGLLDPRYKKDLA
ncbi:hypothetical protein SAMN05428985_103742 [Nocardioides sp. YR527]|uniref:hypothetical protein n=1 Tax=Nocardioides sp. YR527 TaxID=1881028 RepID=UPI000889E3EF|nr:hypothetical protein [Nocardioides sp. YR527]SDK35789.1 hypothetical protein SAMN05428985_103742 [Nocardioides sp. YR527]